MVSKDKDVLAKILDILQIPPSGQKRIRKQFGKILLLRFWRVFLNQLPKEKKKQFLAFLKQPKVSQKKITEWLKRENISLTSESNQKIDTVFKDSINKLVAILVKNINQDEKTKLLALVREENNK